MSLNACETNTVRKPDFETVRVCDQAAWLEAPGRIARSQSSAREAGLANIESKNARGRQQILSGTGVFIPRKSGRSFKIIATDAQNILRLA